MRIKEGIYSFKLSSKAMGQESIINLTVIYDNDELILVDAGLPHQFHQIREAIEEEGLEFYKLRKIIFTHQDIDHIGSASEILKERDNNIKMISFQEEKPYIEGTKKPVKLSMLEQSLDYLPEKMNMFYDKLKICFEKFKVNINETLSDGQVLPYCGGITVIHTPGHTPGHISLYVNKFKLLIAGDILVVNEGTLCPCDKSLNYDDALNYQSIKKLTNYDIKKVVCYHGGIYEDNVNSCIRELAGR